MTRRPGLTQAESDAVDRLVGRAKVLRGDVVASASADADSTVELSAWDRLTAAVQRWETVSTQSAPASDYDDLCGLYWPPGWTPEGGPLGLPG